MNVQLGPDAQPQRFADLDFTPFFLHPMDGPRGAANVQAALACCLARLQWRQSLQCTNGPKNPTSDVLARWIWDRLRVTLPL